MNIAFIGFGFSGNSILEYMVQKIDKIERTNTTISIYDRGGFFGFGIAYNTENKHILLNRESSKMSIDYLNQEDFKKSCNVNNTYIERAIFGDYLKKIFNDNLSKLENSGVGVSIFKENIINITKKQAGIFYIQTQECIMQILSY